MGIVQSSDAPGAGNNSEKADIGYRYEGVEPNWGSGYEPCSTARRLVAQVSEQW